MINLLSKECITNIVGQIARAWDRTSDVPNSRTLENLIYKSVKPFYPEARWLGQNTTIVDVAIGNIAFDIKGVKAITHLDKFSKRTNFVKKTYITQTVPSYGNIHVGVDNYVVTQARRPTVDLQDYKGNPELIINEQMDEYEKWASDTTKQAGCDQLYSAVVAYGEDTKRNIRSVSFGIEPFQVKRPVSYSVVLNQDTLSPYGYVGYDSSNTEVARIQAYSRNSSNFSKQYSTSQHKVISWSIEETQFPICTEDSLLAKYAITSSS